MNLERVQYATKYLRHEILGPLGEVTAVDLKVHPETVYLYQHMNSTVTDRRVPALSVLYQKPSKPTREVNVNGITVPEWPPAFGRGTYKESGLLTREFLDDDWVLQRRGHIFMLEHQQLRIWSQFFGTQLLPRTPPFHI